MEFSAIKNSSGLIDCAWKILNHLDDIEGDVDLENDIQSIGRGDRRSDTAGPKESSKSVEWILKDSDES